MNDKLDSKFGEVKDKAEAAIQATAARRPWVVVATCMAIGFAIAATFAYLV